MPTKKTKSSPGVKRVTISLPAHVLEDVDTIASMMGVGRSAFLSSILSQTLPLVRATAETLMQGVIKDLDKDYRSGVDSETCLKRYRDASQASIDGLIESLLAGGQDDLFNGK